MSKLQTLIKNKQSRYKQSGIKEIFKDENGAIDLASIMVGVLVIGLIGGVIASTVFAVIPWAQDNAAKQQLDSIVQAENAYYGLSAATPSPLPAGYMVNSFANSADLEKANLLKTNARYCAVTTNDGKGYEGYSQSGSGKIWKVTNGDVSPSAFTGTLPSDCTFITAGFDTTPAPVVPYVDPTPTKTILTYQCDATTTILSPIINVAGSYTWNDGTTSTTSTTSVAKSLTGGVKYTLIFEGTFSSMDSSINPETKAGAKCIRSLDHWGSASGTTRADYAFYGATNLTSVPANIPTTLTSMNYMFYGATSFNDANVRSWDVSKVTNMTGMFSGATALNQDLSAWNTANVTTMAVMFYGATAMNGAMNSWNTAKVTSMDRMFYGASSFNQPLDKWVTTNVTNMLLMFYGAPYTQNLTTWDMNKITKMGFMLNNPDSSQLPKTTHPLMTRITYQCDATTTILSSVINVAGSYTWNDGTTNTTSAVKSLTGGVKYTLIFEGTFSSMDSSINPETKAGAKCIRSLDHWGSASSSTRADYAFYGATNLTSVPANIPATLTSMNYMFYGATSFNDANVRSWDVSKVTNMIGTFSGATALNQDLSAWNTANVTTMAVMFYGATAMNGAMNSWNTAKVTSMDRMFYGASSFNQPLDKWVTTNVTNMLLMFYGAPYTQNLTTWDMNNISKMGFMLNNPDSSQLPKTTHPVMTRITYQCDVTTTVLSSVINGAGSYTWNDGTTNTTSAVKSLTGGVKYTLIFEGTFASMDSSINPETKAGANCIRSLDHWGSASSSTRADYAFYGATNLTSVPAIIPATLTSMGYMFYGATSFNDANVRSWDVSKVTNMASMFSGATALNQDLSAWNTAVLTNGTLFAPASFPDAYLPPKTSK